MTSRRLLVHVATVRNARHQHRQPFPAYRSRYGVVGIDTTVNGRSVSIIEQADCRSIVPSRRDVPASDRSAYNDEHVAPSTDDGRTPYDRSAIWCPAAQMGKTVSGCCLIAVASISVTIDFNRIRPLCMTTVMDPLCDHLREINQTKRLRDARVRNNIESAKCYAT